MSAIAPAWFAGLTLAERTGASSRPFPRADAAALAAWRAERPFITHDDLWQARLAEGGLCDDELAGLLAETPEALAARVPAPPWLTRLHADLTSSEPFDPALAGAIAGAEDNHRRGSFRLVAPFTRRLASETRASLGDAVARGVPMDVDTMVTSVLAYVPAVVASAITRTLALEVKVARHRGLLEGETPEARFDFFIDAMSDPEVLPSFWERHPVLARHTVVALEGYTAAVVELAGALGSAFPEIARTLLPPGDRLVAVRPNPSETHRGGRIVMMLEHASGTTVVYKPRSAEVDLAYARALAWVAERAPELAVPRPPRVVSQGDTSFHERVEASTCGSHAALTRYYERQGVHLALIFALCACDMHAENVLVAGEHPVIIDLEALLQPSFIAQDVGASPRAPNPAQAFLERSVLAPLFLPMRLGASDESPGVDVSAVGARSGQQTAIKGVVMKHVGTDDVRADFARDDVASLGLRPGIDGVEADPAAFEGDVLRGFRGAWRALEENREAFADGPLDAFRDVSVRVLARSTDFYNTLLERSFHPSNLDDGLARERVFDLLYRTAPASPHHTRVIASERADLHQTDVPFFTMRTGTRDMMDARGDVLPDMFVAPPYELARARVLGLSSAERVRQEWVVRASFASMTTGPARASWTASRTDLAPAAIDAAALLGRAVAIGHRIASLAVRDGQRVGWPTLELVRGRDWTVTAAGSDLYGGTPGIALFLGHLGAQTGDTAFTALARDAVASALPHLDARVGGERAIGVGLAGGVGALPALAALADLFGDDTLRAHARRLARTLGRHVDADRHFDLFEGVAGSVVSLLELHRAHPDDELLDLASRGVARLREAAVATGDGVAWRSPLFDAPPTGLAHGASGVALALVRYAAVTGDRAALDLVRRAFDFERAELHAPHDDASIVGLCHGAPGMLLARVEASVLVDDALVRGDLARASEITMHDAFGQNHSICHGDLGNVAILTHALTLLGDGQRDEMLRARDDRLTRTCASIDLQGPVMGLPNGLESPGFFVGLAGLGYELLRHASPDRTPPSTIFSHVVKLTRA